MQQPGRHNDYDDANVDADADDGDDGDDADDADDDADVDADDDGDCFSLYVFCLEFGQNATLQLNIICIKFQHGLHGIFIFVHNPAPAEREVPTLPYFWRYLSQSPALAFNPHPGSNSAL